MSTDVQTFLFVVGAWILISCVVVPLVLVLAATYERYAGHRIEDAFLTPMERKAEAQLIPADAVEATLYEAERICQASAIPESLWLLTCAPDPERIS